jgi:rRNA-processing protein FCF1
MIEIDDPVILDANILIDLCKINKSILRILCKELKKVMVPILVLREVDGLNRQDAENLGITVIDSDLEILEKAFGLMSGLSYQDSLCLLTASRENYICVTNDKRLKRECREKGVRSLWGPELLLFLFQKGRISRQEARKLIAEMAAVNNRITKTIIQEFQNQLDLFACS